MLWYAGKQSAAVDRGGPGHAPPGKKFINGLSEMHSDTFSGPIYLSFIPYVNDGQFFDQFFKSKGGTYTR